MRKPFFLRVAPLAIGSLLAACNGSSGGPDAPIEEAGPTDVVHADRVGSDVTAMDSGDAAPLDGIDAPADTTTVDSGPQPVDAMLPDVSIADGGACSPIASAVLSAESSVRTRDVFATGEADTFGFAASLARDGSEAIWWDNLTHTGAMANLGVVSDTPGTAHVRGGSFAPFAELYALAYSSDETGNDEIWVNVMQSNGSPELHSRVQISNDAVPSRDPQIVQRIGGYLVAWRSVESTRTRLLAATLDTIVTTPSTPVEVSVPGANVDSFRLLGTLTPAMNAIVYLDTQSSTGDLRIQPLNADGSLNGASTSLASGTDLSGGIDAVASNGDAVVVWTQPSRAPTVHLRRFGVVAGGMGTGAPVDLGTAVPAGASSPGLDVDDAGGFDIGYRSTSSGTTYLAMARLAVDFTVRDSSILAGAASGGRVAIVSTAGFSTYGLGWADDFASGTAVRVLVAQCP